MSADLIRKDLILLVADKNMEASLKGLLTRFRSLKLRQVTFDLYVHPERDPGCLLRAHDFLAEEPLIRLEWPRSRRLRAEGVRLVRDLPDGDFRRGFGQRL